MDTAKAGASRKEVEQFYNKFREHQKKLGINIRHRTIYKNALRAGLTSYSKVLEVGCGIGTVSHLLLKKVTRGVFTGVDISPESIELARQINGRFKNAEFVVSDMSDFTSRHKFDFIVLPDVLEHIPVEQHAAIFNTLAKVSAEQATVVINIPEPNCLNHVRRTHPEKLQIIDQSLNIKDLLTDAYRAGFELVCVEPYGLQYEAPEYLYIQLKRSPVKYSYKRKGFVQRVRENLFSKF